ncbi:hypothetical protein GTQ40_16450 [Flavobacteriaceae bacterium R38]|nr:hypothetical protein [Flavobacteriaceae bacterium R38]
MKKKKFNSKKLSFKKNTVSKLDSGKVSGGQFSTNLGCVVTGDPNVCDVTACECNSIGCEPTNGCNPTNGCGTFDFDCPTQQPFTCLAC